MFNNRRLIVFGAIFALSAVVLHCVWLWQPERQALLHTENLLKAAGKRNFTKVSEMLDPQYADRWGHDKSAAVARASDVLRQFFALTIESELVDCTRREEGVVVSTRLRFQGKGAGLAEIVKEEVNRLTDPFQFEWKRSSGKPWDWKLVRVDQPQLQMGGRDF